MIRFLMVGIFISTLMVSIGHSDVLWSDVKNFVNEAGLTPLELRYAQAMFDTAIKNPQIRVKHPGFECSGRAENFQQWMQDNLKVKSGLLNIGCPSDNITIVNNAQKAVKFSLYHTTNLVMIRQNGIDSLYVMDAQFGDGPVALEEYLRTIVKDRPLEPFVRRLHNHMPREGENSPCRWYIHYRKSLISVL